MRQARVVAWTLCGLALAAAAAAVVLGIVDAGSFDSLPADRKPSDGVAEVALPNFVLVAGFGVVGAVVASHLPRNPVGWFLCGIPALLALGQLGEGLYWHAVATGSANQGWAKLSVWIASWWWIPVVYMAFVFLPFLFPTGRPLTRRWRAVAWVAAGGGVMLFVGTAFRPGGLEGFEWVDNPLGVPGLPEVFGAFGFAVWVAGSLVALASLVVRFRRSRGVERQQLKWLTAAVPLLVLAWVVNGVLGDDAPWAIPVTGLLGVDLAVALAIMRYRLYDIDVVINRALVYGSLTAILAATYLSSVLVLQLVLSGVTGDSSLAIAASTLAVAALFRPARTRVQAQVDRRFYRRKYDAEQTLAAFAGRLRDEVALDALSAELRAVVVETMQPSHVSLWLREA